MKIRRGGSWRSSLELAPGAGDALRSFSRRESLILELRDEQGRRGLGEAAPLSGLSRETLEEVEADLTALPESWTFEEVEASHSLALCEVWRTQRLPSLRFALETALLDLQAKRLGVPFEAVLGGQTKARQSTARLVTQIAELEGLEVPAGTALKVKVGRPGEVGRELRALSRARASYPAPQELRLDANGAWSLDDWTAIGPELAALEPVWVEDPVAPRLWLELPRSPVPLAVDAPLGLSSPELVDRLLAREDTTAVILKPTLLGGLAAARRMARRAATLGLRVVYSHCYEGPVGFSAIAAASLTDENATVAAGLGPHPGLHAHRFELERVLENALVRGIRPGLGFDGEMPRT